MGEGAQRRENGLVTAGLEAEASDPCCGCRSHPRRGRIKNFVIQHDLLQAFKGGSTIVSLGHRRLGKPLPVIMLSYPMRAQ
jgi:hypothetical protein